MTNREMWTKERMTRLRSVLEDAALVGYSALAQWGADVQRDMAVEECAELVAAIQQERRGRVGESAVRSEIADVLIMTLQLASVYGVSETIDAVANKTRRLRERIAESRSAASAKCEAETPCYPTDPEEGVMDSNGREEDEESDIIIAGRQVPFVQVGMIVHPDDCLNCEREGSPLWCSALVCDIHDDEIARFGMMATLLFRNGECREERCDELRRRWRLARDFDQTRVYTGRWGTIPRGSVWPVAEVNEDA